MKLKTALIAAVLLAGLFALQFGVMEKSDVQKLERASQNLGELKTSTLLPTYIGSLFLGSFRAVAIDFLWIQMYRMGEQEHRYFERVEYMDLITKLQPRNPEAWAYQGWDAAYNIANQFRVDDDLEELRMRERQLESAPPPATELKARIAKLKVRIPEKDEQYRKWVNLGLLKLAEGSRHIPDDAYLKYEVGKALWTKAAWGPGILEQQFLTAVEEDDEVQRILGEGKPATGPRTSFELAEIWFAKGKATLEAQIKEGRFRTYRTLAETMSRPPEEERRHVTTQMGLNIDLASFTGFIQQVRFLNGILKWSRARGAAPDKAAALFREAAASFRGAAEQAELYRREFSLIESKDRAFHDARADLCRGMAGLCDEQATYPTPLSAEHRAKLLQRLEPIRWNPVDRTAPAGQQIQPPDERYLLDYMGELKRSLGGDVWEYNDDLYCLHRGNFLPAGRTAEATIGPDLRDVDWHHFYAAPRADAHEGHDHGGKEPPPEPITATFRIARRGDLALQVTVLTLQKGALVPFTSFTITDDKIREFEATASAEGSMCVIVNAVDPSGPAPANAAYWIEARGVKK